MRISQEMSSHLKGEFLGMEGGRMGSRLEGQEAKGGEKGSCSRTACLSASRSVCRVSLSVCVGYAATRDDWVWELEG